MAEAKVLMMRLWNLCHTGTLGVEVTGKTTCVATAMPVATTSGRMSASAVCVLSQVIFQTELFAVVVMRKYGHRQHQQADAA